LGVFGEQKRGMGVGKKHKKKLIFNLKVGFIDRKIKREKK